MEFIFKLKLSLFCVYLIVPNLEGLLLNLILTFIFALLFFYTGVMILFRGYNDSFIVSVRKSSYSSVSFFIFGILFKFNSIHSTGCIFNIL